MKKYPQIEFHELVSRRPDYTQASLNGVLQSLFEGIFLTALVLMLFLHAWRNAAVGGWSRSPARYWRHSSRCTRWG